MNVNCPKYSLSPSHGSSEVCSDLVTSNTSLAMNMVSLDTMEEEMGANVTTEHSGEQAQANLVYPFSIVAGYHLLSASAFIILGETIYYLKKGINVLLKP